MTRFTSYASLGRQKFDVKVIDTRSHLPEPNDVNYTLEDQIEVLVEQLLVQSYLDKLRTKIECF